ncbi:MFS transporter [Pseudonocardia ailaonensis]|uniref:MFS transporter n=1 Tax=Pseudonocardia ailaonensis TaxID=367279 RepID=A0ABN2N5P5_9PSEU
MANGEAEATQSLSRKRFWLVTGLLSLGQLMVVLDVSIVNVALPSIRTDLGFSEAGLAWVVNGYALAYAGFLLLGGRAADLFGRRRIFVLGLAVFTLASLAGAVAPNGLVLVIARVAQGIGGAILSPATLTILTTTFTTPAQRGKALGVWSAVAGGGAAIGTVLGGVLTGLLSWRWILLVNLPLGVLGIVGAYLLLVESRGGSPADIQGGGQRRSLDLGGAALVTTGLVALVYGTINSGEQGWGAVTTLVPFVGGLVLLAWFVVHEHRIAAAPLLPLGLLRLGSVAVGNASMFLLATGVVAHFFFLTLYLQNVLGWSPLAAGLAFLPGAAAMTVGAYAGPALLKLIPLRVLLVTGPLLSTAGLAWLSLLPLQATYAVHLLVPMVLVTLGAGIAMMPLALAATGGVPRSEAGVASGLINTTRQVGGAVGLGVLAAVAASVTGGSADPALQVSGQRAAFVVAAAFTLAAALIPLVGLRTRPAPAAAEQRPAEQPTDRLADTEVG